MTATPCLKTFTALPTEPPSLTICGVNRSGISAHLAPRFIKATLVAYADDPDELTGWFNARRQHYLEKTREITAPHRKLSRINQKFATLYAVGRLGIRLGFFPWTPAELLEALLSCHRDHIALVARHMVPPSGPQKSALTRLTDYLRNNRDLFTDLRTTELKAENHNHDAWRGYVDADKAGDDVFLLSNSVFEKVVGGLMQHCGSRSCCMAVA